MSVPDIDDMGQAYDRDYDHLSPAEFATAGLNDVCDPSSGSSMAAEWAMRLEMEAQWRRLIESPPCDPDGYPDEAPEIDDSAWFDPATDFEPSEADAAWWAENSAKVRSGHR